MSKPKVFFDITIGGNPAGRIVMEVLNGFFVLVGSFGYPLLCKQVFIADLFSVTASC